MEYYAPAHKGRRKAGHMAAQTAQQEGTGFIYGKNAVAELLKSGAGHQLFNSL